MTDTFNDIKRKNLSCRDDEVLTLPLIERIHKLKNLTHVSDVTNKG